MPFGLHGRRGLRYAWGCPRATGPGRRRRADIPSRRIAIATSFPPETVRFNASRHLEDYDRLCVQSWVACGFRVLSVNRADEIAALARRHPEVEFVASDENAEMLLGRKTPFIRTMLTALSHSGAPVLGIVNSDILFEPVPAWQQIEPLVAGRTVVTGQRYDTRSLLGGALHQYLPGFDYFFFDPEAARDLAKHPRPFSMGLPWWDYWFPLTLGMRGYRFRCLARPAVLHLGHDAKTDARSPLWRRLALELARDLTSTAEAADPGLPPPWRDLLDHARDLAQAPEEALTGDTLDERIIKLSELSVAVIGAAVESFGDMAERALPETSTPASGLSVPLTAAFANLPARVAAGHALRQALWEDAHGNAAAAERRFRAALEDAPQDGGIYFLYGNFLFNRGAVNLAVPLLQKAAALAPSSAGILSSLGSALGQLGRTGEAIACFERALAADPLHGAGYYNLVVALYPYGHDAIIRRFEVQLAAAPDFPEREEWRQRIAQALDELKRPSTPPNAPIAGPVKSR